MTNFKTRLKSITAWALSFLPSPLPVNESGLKAFIEAIIALGAMPSNDSFRSAIATMILHLGPSTTWMSKRYFIVALRKSVSNQIAYGLIQDIKEKQKLEQQKLQEAPAKMVQEA